MARKRISRLTAGASIRTTPPIGGSSNVLEQIAGFCDGRTLTGADGSTTYTLENVTTVSSMTTSHTALFGSSITYLPPAGTKTVIYSWNFNTVWSDNNNILYHLKAQLGNGAGSESFSDITISRYSRFEYGNGYTRPIIENIVNAIIVIGDTDDIANAKVSSWGIPRTLRVAGREYSSSYDTNYNDIVYWNGTGNSDPRVPYLEITSLST